MKCKYPGCVTMLSKYNKGNFCFTHERILTQRDVKVKGGKFFQGTREVSKERLKRFKGLTIEDYIGRDRW